jgi:hypothetical protein
MFNNWSIHSLPILPVWLIVVITIGLLALLAFGSVLLLRRQVPPRWVAILGGWRVIIIAVFALVLLQPVVSFTRPVKREPEMMVLIDTSESMALPGAAKNSRLDEIRPLLESGDLAAALRSRYQLHWYSFDASARPLDSKEFNGLKVQRSQACGNHDALRRQPRRRVGPGPRVGCGAGARAAGQ